MCYSFRLVLAAPRPAPTFHPIPASAAHAVSMKTALLPLGLQLTPATAHGMPGYHRGQPALGMVQTLMVWHMKLAGITPGLRGDLNGERDGEKYRVMNNLEDRTYVREVCKRRRRSSAHATPTQKEGASSPHSP